MALANTADPDVVIEAFADTVSDAAVVWDVGAYVGDYTRLAAGSGAAVRAFEPEPRNYDLLTDTTPDAVSCHRIALAEEPGYAHLRRYRPDDGSTWSLGPVDGGTTPVTTMDALVAEGWPAPDVLKIDVEGAEARVIDGGRETLDKTQPVVFVEVHAGKANATARALSRAGYTGVDRLAERQGNSMVVEYWRATSR